MLTTLLTDTSLHPYPLWLPRKAKQGIPLVKDTVPRLWDTGDYPRAGKMLPSLSQRLVWMPRGGHAFPSPCSPLRVCQGLSPLWMPKLSTHSLEEVAALPQSIPGNP